MPYDVTFQSKVLLIVIEAIEQYLSSPYNGRVYALAGPGDVFPYMVYQSQDGGGLNDDFADQNGWKGLVTFRSIDTTLSGAFNCLSEMSALLPMVTSSGYDIHMKPVHPMLMPIEKTTKGNVYTVALITDVSVYPKE